MWNYFFLLVKISFWKIYAVVPNAWDFNSSQFWTYRVMLYHVVVVFTLGSHDFFLFKSTLERCAGWNIENYELEILITENTLGLFFFRRRMVHPTLAISFLFTSLIYIVLFGRVGLNFPRRWGWFASFNFVAIGLCHGLQPWGMRRCWCSGAVSAS